ncbi:uncharacterized protein BYT42DRAFT_578300 [Radiomyces spectabilis]|uniref:uncharacterized protein n=1 Tax=Radiomyces spectabilis TaxID=64574 RepID=UPI002220802B|nr:uncharacterized protein BYT42DRAFT_578300 [Radiomyces spectabilis]KAI8372878.1 hypothetical protein BYT42DRAFT_578300 [Radiomyces spectabilis]
MKGMGLPFTRYTNHLTKECSLVVIVSNWMKSTLAQQRLDAEQQPKFACAQVLSGSILKNVIKSDTILVNAVEAYGRTKSVDAHRQLSTSGSSILTASPKYRHMAMYSNHQRWFQAGGWNANVRLLGHVSRPT